MRKRGKDSPVRSSSTKVEIRAKEGKLADKTPEKRRPKRRGLGDLKRVRRRGSTPSLSVGGFVNQQVETGNSRSG